MAHDKVTIGFERVMYGCFFPLFVFLPISTAGFEIFSSIIIALFFIKRITLLTLLFKEEKSRRISNPIVHWFSRFCKVFKPIRTPLRAAVGLFVFANFLSVLVSQYPGLSWKGFFGKTVEAVILFFSFIEVVNSRRRLNPLLWVFAGVVAFISFDAMVQLFTKKDLIFGRPFTEDHRVTASFRHPNDFGGYLIVAIPFLLSMGIWAWPWRKKKEEGRHSVRNLLLIIIAFVLAYIALGLTYSRGSWVGFFAGLILMMFLDRKKLYIPLFVGIVFILIFSVSLEHARNVSFVTDDIAQEGWLSRERTAKELKLVDVDSNVYIPEGTFAEDENPSLKKRWDNFLISISRFSGTGRSGFWREAIHIFASAPILGTGLNTYSEVAPKFKITWGMWPHNCYLQMAAETGIIGLGAFLWVIFLVFREALRALRSITEKYYKALLCGSLAGLTAFLVHGFLDTTFYSVNLGNLMWMMMGLIIAVTQLIKKENLSA